MRPDDVWMDAMKALSDRYRRQLLVALVEHNPQSDDDVDPLNVVDEGRVDDDLLRAEMVHKHLPALAAKGFIAWDRETGEISRGPNWTDIEPILRLLHDHRGELPDGWI